MIGTSVIKELKTQVKLPNTFSLWEKFTVTATNEFN